MPGITIGGQAVLEGVMMRAPGVMTVAVRRRDGSIVIRKNTLKNPVSEPSFLRFPFIRGIWAFFQSVVLGFKALDYSSNVAMHDLDLMNSISPIPGSFTIKNEQTRIASKGFLSGTIGLAVCIGLIFFLFFPLYLADHLITFFPLTDLNIFFCNILEGLIRILLLILYVSAISYIPEIERVFQYHGAEHKAINAFEAGFELSVESAKSLSRLHYRCGSTFLFSILTGAILVFSFIPHSSSTWFKLLLRIVLLPLIAGIMYEFMVILADYRGRAQWVFLKPGLWLQRLTTREPNDEQLEVSLIALREALEYADNFTISAKSKSEV